MTVGHCFDQKLSYLRIQPNSETKANILEEQHKAKCSFNIVSKDKLSLDHLEKENYIMVLLFN